MKKKQEYKITYHYIKPKNEAEIKERVFKMNGIYDLLFNIMLEEGKIKLVDDKLYVLDQDKNWVKAESMRKPPNQ